MQGKSFFQSGKCVSLRGVAAASLFAAALTGCSTSAPLFTSDGRPTTAVQCSAASPWENCTDHARGICQGDIDVLAQSTADGVNKLLFACKAK